MTNCFIAVALCGNPVADDRILDYDILLFILYIRYQKVYGKLMATTIYHISANS